MATDKEMINEFMADIAATPHDPLPRKALADYLLDHCARQEEGDPDYDQAMYLLNRLGITGERMELAPTQVERLLEKNFNQWFPELISQDVVLTDGFPQALRVADWQNQATGQPLNFFKDALAKYPITSISIKYLGNGAEAAERFLALPGIERLTSLRIQDVMEDQAILLVQSPKLKNLRKLEFPNGHLGPAFAQALVDAYHSSGEEKHLCHLDTLRLNSTALGPLGAQILAASPLIKQLDQLDISSAGIMADGARALAQSPYAATIRAITLRNNNLNNATLAAFSRMPRVVPLTLDIGRNADITDAGVEPLFPDHRAFLRNLIFDGTGVSPRMVDRLRKLKPSDRHLE